MRWYDCVYLYEKHYVPMQNNGPTLKYLALGDSYTIGESVSEEYRYPVQLVRQLQQNGVNFSAPNIIAKTGWKTGDLLKAIEKQKPAEDHDLVSLLIGVNNQYQRKPIDIFVREFEILLKKAIQLAAGNPENVLVISIPDYGYTPFGNSMQIQISAELDEYNSLNKSISVKYGAWYVDITDISRKVVVNNDLIADDKLHPSDLQYKLWTERIMENEGFVKRFLERNKKSES